MHRGDRPDVGLGDRVVAAEDDRDRAGGDDLRDDALDRRVIAGRVGGNDRGVAEVDDPELGDRVDPRLEMRARRAAGGADRARPEPGARPVGGEIVHRRPDDRDVDALELGGILGRTAGRRTSAARRSRACRGGRAHASVRADRTRPRSYASLYPGRVISRARAQSAARVGALCFVVLWLLSDQLQAAIPFWLPFAILAATEIEFVVRGMLERRHGVEPSPGLAPPAGCRRRRPRLGRDGRRGGRAGARRRRTEAAASVQPAHRRRRRDRHRALRVRLPRRPERRLALRLVGQPGPGRAALHGRGGPDRGPARSRSSATTGMRSRGSAPTRPVSPSSHAGSRISSRRSAGRSTGSRSSTRSVTVTTPRSRSAFSPTRPRTSAGSATRPRRSATRCRRVSRSAGGSASTPPRRAP